MDEMSYVKVPPLFRRGGKGEVALKNISLSLRRERVRVRVYAPQLKR